MIEVTLTTGRTVSQGEAMHKGKRSEEYKNAAGICELDSEDMKALGARDGDAVRVSTDAGKVVVRAATTGQGAHKGIAFIPMGPWANLIVNFDTSSTGMPSFKGIAAKIELAKGEKVLNAAELIQSSYSKFRAGGR